MASKVNPTPTLTGADADVFIQKLNTPSTDEEVNSEKNYYIYDSETGAMFKVEPNGLENPRVEGWYELDETIKNYVVSHVAQTDEGLSVLSTNSG